MLKREIKLDKSVKLTYPYLHEKEKTMFNYKRMAKLEKNIDHLQSLINKSLEIINPDDTYVYRWLLPSERLQRRLDEIEAERTEQKRVAEIHEIIEQKLKERATSSKSEKLKKKFDKSE